MFNVYGILCKTTWKVYYGSTEFTVEERLKLHEKDYKAYLEGKYKYVTSYEVLKNNNYEIKLLETCDDDLHMCNREGYYVRTFPCVNIRVPGRTRKEYYETFKEEILEKKKEYRETFKVEIAEKDKARYEANKETILEKKKEKYTCECGSTLRKDGKSEHEKSIKHKKYLENL